MKILKKIYHTLPLPLRQRFSTLFWKFFYSLKSNFNPFYPRVFIFKGEEKHSHLPLTFAYVGMPSQTQTYWVQAILAPGFQKRDLGRHFWHSLTPLLKKEDCNLFLIENNFLTLPYFSKDPGFNIPVSYTHLRDLLDGGKKPQERVRNTQRFVHRRQ